EEIPARPELVFSPCRACRRRAAPVQSSLTNTRSSRREDTDMADTSHLPAIINRLHSAYPNARYELDSETPVQLLVATILAAQCTDERVNRVPPALFARSPDAVALAGADQGELEELVRPTGYYRQKAKAIKNACQALVDRYGGQVPRDMDDMLTLPGVARK